jgi:hypothetical protein
MKTLPIADCRLPITKSFAGRRVALLKNLFTFCPARTNENSPRFQPRDSVEKRISPGGAAETVSFFLSSLRDVYLLTHLPAVKTAGYYQASLRDEQIHAPKLQIQPATGNRQSAIGNLNVLWISL